MRRLTAEDVARRFAASYTVDASGCWLWSGRLNYLGYGTIYLGMQKLAYAHRYSWTVHRGPIPDGIDVLHKCDVRNCVCPDHLFLGTHQDNMADRNAKGRQSTARGSANGMALLTESDVLAIRSVKAPMSQLARGYGVTIACIWDVKNRKSWRQVP